MARVRQTARKRAVGAGKSRAKAAAVNAGAEAESETESESESESDGFGQADAESEAPSPAAFCAPGAEPAAKLWSFSTVDNNLGEDSECEPEEYDEKVLQFEQAQRKRQEANAQKWSRMARRWPITHPIIDNHTSNYFGANHTSNSGTNWHHLNLVPTTPITHPIILEFRQLGV